LNRYYVFDLPHGVLSSLLLVAVLCIIAFLAFVIYLNRTYGRGAAAAAPGRPERALALAVGNNGGLPAFVQLGVAAVGPQHCPQGHLRKRPGLGLLLRCLRGGGWLRCRCRASRTIKLRMVTSPTRITATTAGGRCRMGGGRIRGFSGLVC